MTAPMMWVRDPDVPAGIGWCEAIIIVGRWFHDAGEVRHCFTRASRTRDGREVCGLHRSPLAVTYGPPRPES